MGERSPIERTGIMNISDYSYYRLYREAEARMERELEARRISIERSTPRERRRILSRAGSWLAARTVARKALSSAFGDGTMRQ